MKHTLPISHLTGQGLNTNGYQAGLLYDKVGSLHIILRALFLIIYGGSLYVFVWILLGLQDWFLWHGGVNWFWLLLRIVKANQWSCANPFSYTSKYRHRRSVFFNMNMISNFKKPWVPSRIWIQIGNACSLIYWIQFQIINVPLNRNQI